MNMRCLGTPVSYDSRSSASCCVVWCDVARRGMRPRRIPPPPTTNPQTHNPVSFTHRREAPPHEEAVDHDLGVDLVNHLCVGRVCVVSAVCSV